MKFKCLWLCLCVICSICVYAQDNVQAIVIHMTDSMVYAGFSGDEAPRVVFPNVVGQSQDGKFYVGKEAVIRSGVLELQYPIERGEVVSWEDLQRVLSYLFSKQLRVSVQEHPVLMTRVPVNSETFSEELTQIMFETFKVPAFYLTSSSVLALYASGRTTGLVVDSEDGVTFITPVYEGNVLSDVVQQINLGDRDVVEYLTSILADRGYSLTTSGERETVRDIKNQLCFITLDYEYSLENAETTTDFNQNYTLPDGQTIVIGSERFCAPEILFQPDLAEIEEEGIAANVYNSIMKCDANTRNALYTNIVLCGEATMYEGIKERLQQEISKYVSANTPIKVVAVPERKYLAWIGGSILSNLSTFQEKWISADEYEEVGAAIVHEKCPE